MKVDRLILNIGGMLLVVVGVVYGVDPGFVAEQAELSSTGGGLTDIRAVYGGVQFGLGCLFLWSARDPRRFRSGLMAMGLVFGSVGAFRVLGLLVDGEFSTFRATNLILEIAVAALCAVRLGRQQQSKALAS